MKDNLIEFSLLNAMIQKPSCRKSVGVGEGWANESSENKRMKQNRKTQQKLIPTTEEAGEKINVLNLLFFRQR